MKSEIKALTGLRFIAAFLVFIFHVNMRSKMLFLPWPVYNIVSHGAFGVTVFFVLSGFLLTYSHMRDFPNGQMRDSYYVRQFFFKRVARIYPAYLVGLIFFACAGLLFGQLPELDALLADTLMVQAILPSISMKWYGSGAWSVSIEIFFYIIFPFLLPILIRIKKKIILWLLLFIIISVETFGGFSHTIWPQYVSYPLMYANPLFRCSEFIAGMIASLLVFRFNWRVKEYHAISLLLVTCAYIAGFGPHFIGFVAHNWLVVPCIIVVLAAIIDISQTKFLRLLTHDWLLYAGRVSYCFYLAQLPIFYIQDLYLQSHLSLPWWSAPITLLATCATGAFLHHFIELPAHRWLIDRNKHRQLMLAQSSGA